MLLAFAGLIARYTVYYGHECARINPWTIPSAAEVVSLEEFHLLVCGIVPEDVKKGSGDHDHDKCPVCETYEQLVHALPVEYSAELRVLFEFAQTRLEFQSAFAENRTAVHQPTRAPPSEA